MTEFVEEIIVSAAPEKVWKTLSDIGNIYLWNPGVVHSEMMSLGNVDIGACRRCDLGGKNYLVEEIVEFEKLNKLTMRITDTNLPFRTADIRFFVESQHNQSLVKVSPKYDLKYGWLGRVLDLLVVQSHYRKGMRNLLFGLKQYVEETDES